MQSDRVTAVVTKGNSILVIHRLRDGEEYYVLPGGGIEQGELEEVALMRELQEETSVSARLIQKLTTYVMRQGRRDHVYLCEYLAGEPKIAPDSVESNRSSETNVYTPQWIEIRNIPNIKMWTEEVQLFLIKYFK